MAKFVTTHCFFSYIQINTIASEQPQTVLHCQSPEVSVHVYVVRQEHLNLDIHNSSCCCDTSDIPSQRVVDRSAGRCASAAFCALIL